jgi:hypothetical protein
MVYEFLLNADEIEKVDIANSEKIVSYSYNALELETMELINIGKV